MRLRYQSRVTLSSLKTLSTTPRAILEGSGGCCWELREEAFVELENWLCRAPEEAA